MSFNVESRNQDGSKTKLSLTIEGTISTLRENNKYAKVTKRTECKELADTINGIVGSNFKVIIDPTISQNANVTVPLIDRNNPMWKKVLRDWFGSLLDEEGVKAVYRSSDEMVVGEIDSKGKLKGYFKDVESTITVSYDMIYPTAKWPVSAGGSTAIILHEIGHFVNYLRSLGWMYRTNYILGQANERLMGVGDLTKRVEIINGIVKDEKLDLSEDVEYLAKINDDKTLSTVLVGGVLTKMRHELNSDIFDARGFEALSDNFAAQHGNGLDLVMGLDSMPNMKYIKRGTVQRLMLTTLSSSMRVATLVLNPAMASIFTLLSIVFYNPHEKIYDDPIDRFNRVANALILTIRENRDGDNDKLINDVEQIHSILESYTDSTGFIETLYEVMTPVGRTSKTLRELNQHLEEFSNNKLYLAAAKFNRLG